MLSSHDKNNFHKKLPNCEGGTIRKRQISQKIFISDFMLPESKQFFDALYCTLTRNGYCTPNQKLACFVLQLKIDNTFLKNNKCILKQIVQNNSKMVLNF